MNLHINLILEEEKRSASPVSMKFFVRAASFTIAAVVLVTLFLYLRDMHMVRNDLRTTEKNMAALKPKMDELSAMKANLSKENSILTECMAWQTNRIAWHEQMLRLQQLVPASIQLTEIRMERAIKKIDKKRTAYVYQMHIEGKATSANADEAVDLLRQTIAKAPEFLPFIQDVKTPPGAFKMDTSPTAAKTDRLFEIVCVYIPRVIQ